MHAAARRGALPPSVPLVVTGRLERIRVAETTSVLAPQRSHPVGERRGRTATIDPPYERPLRPLHTLLTRELARPIGFDGGIATDQDDRIWVVKKRPSLGWPLPQRYVSVHLPWTEPSDGPYIAGFVFYKHAFLLSARMNETDGEEGGGDRGAFVPQRVSLDLLKEATWTSLGVAVFDREYHGGARPCLLIKGGSEVDGAHPAMRGLVRMLKTHVYERRDE